MAPSFVPFVLFVVDFLYRRTQRFRTVCQRPPVEATFGGERGLAKYHPFSGDVLWVGESERVETLTRVSFETDPARKARAEWEIRDGKVQTRSAPIVQQGTSEPVRLRSGGRAAQSKFDRAIARGLGILR